MKNYIGYKALGMGFDAHLTLLYTGNLEEDQAKSIEEFLLTIDPSLNHFMGVRQEIKMFGPNNDIPVVTVMVPDYIHKLRETLIKAEIPNPSEFSWNPHVTLDLSVYSIRLPLGMTFDDLGLY